MTIKLIYPALAQILWTFVVLCIMFQRRRRAFICKQVSLADVAVSNERYPEGARLAAANYANQYESPVLFFALIMLALEVGATGYVMTLLAWIFVATRIVHTLIHVGSNGLKARAGVFALGMLCLFGMWVGVILAVL
jgi:hypothetical protein